MSKVGLRMLLNDRLRNGDVVSPQDELELLWQSLESRHSLLMTDGPLQDVPTPMFALSFKTSFCHKTRSTKINEREGIDPFIFHQLF